MATLKKIVIWILLSLPWHKGFGQSVEQAMAGKDNCSAIEVEALKLIPIFYEQNQMDSIELVLDFVAYTCTESAPLRLTRFLLLMQRREFSDSLFELSDIQHIRYDVKMLRPNGKGTDNFYLFNQSLIYTNLTPPFSDKYLSMLRKWSEELASRPNNTPLEKAVLNQMLAASARKNLNSIWWFNGKKHGYETFPKVYQNFHNTYWLTHMWSFGMGYGTYLPDGALYQRMGNQGLLSFTVAKHIGRGTNKLQFNALFPMGKLPQPFTIVRPDTTFQSRLNYMGFAQLEYGHRIWKKSRFFDAHLVAGFQFVEKGIYNQVIKETPEGERDDTENRKMGKDNVSTHGISFGADARLFISEKIAVASQVRYNRFNLGQISINDFSGNAVTANICIIFLVPR
jgi:hypothetical protein